MKYLLFFFIPFFCFSQTIWDGSEITFTKGNNVNINLPQNQDRITDDVWITRGNTGGAIFNIFSETSYIYGLKPILHLFFFNDFFFIPYKAVVSCIIGLASWLLGKILGL